MQTSDEHACRKCVSTEIRNNFNYSESERLESWNLLLACRPSRKIGKKTKITYKDLFDWGDYAFANLEKHKQMPLFPEVVDFILNDEVSFEAEWSALLFLQSVLNSSELYLKCNFSQKRSIANFITYLTEWRIEQHGCVIFLDVFKNVLSLWKS